MSLLRSKMNAIVGSLAIAACSSTADSGKEAKTATAHEAESSSYQCGSGPCGIACAGPSGNACDVAANSCEATGGTATFSEVSDPSVLTRNGEPGCDCMVSCGPRSTPGDCGASCEFSADCVSGLTCDSGSCWAASCYGGGGPRCGDVGDRCSSDDDCCGSQCSSDGVCSYTF
jgi:hypothetical protein